MSVAWRPRDGSDDPSIVAFGSSRDAFGPAMSAGAAEFRNPRHGEPIHNPQCTCRFMGENVPLGARRCLQTPAGPRTAECVVELNVISWRPLGQPCPQATLAGWLANAC